MLKIVGADLHIHTCLSPCATLDMTPLKIVEQACSKGLAIIAVTDHNSAENTLSVMEAAQRTPLRVIPGMEVTTLEEVHIVSLFEKVDDVLAMQDLVYTHLHPGENDEDLFGMQVVTNAFDEVEDINSRLLIGATSLRLDQVVDAIHRIGGLAVAAHIDREAFSIVGQLGFIPPDLDLDAIEVSKNTSLTKARTRFQEYGRFPFIASSDAHALEEIGTHLTRIQLADLNMGELRLAFRSVLGRRILGGKTG